MNPLAPPLPITSFRDLADAYLKAYAGRDPARLYRIERWIALFGDRAFASLTDEDVFRALEQIAAEPARVYHGKDADGRAIFRAKGARTGATVNRFHVALSALFSWAIKRRLAPAGWANPCRKVERRAEGRGVVRFLSAAERERLLVACRAARWERLYLLVVMANTTGARKGELLGLTWGDVDLQAGIAYVRESKNGESRALPLVPAVVTELKRFSNARPEACVFPARGRVTTPRNIESCWRQALARAQVKRFRFHDLRHDCASQLARSGASLLQIADVLGHRQLAMVRRYAHLTTASKAALIQRVLGGIHLPDGHTPALDAVASAEGGAT